MDTTDEMDASDTNQFFGRDDRGFKNDVLSVRTAKPYPGLFDYHIYEDNPAASFKDDDK